MASYTHQDEWARVITKESLADSRMQTIVIDGAAADINAGRDECLRTHEMQLKMIAFLTGGVYPESEETPSPLLPVILRNAQAIAATVNADPHDHRRETPPPWPDVTISRLVSSDPNRVVHLTNTQTALELDPPWSISKFLQSLSTAVHRHGRPKSLNVTFENMNLPEEYIPQLKTIVPNFLLPNGENDLSSCLPKALRTQQYALDVHSHQAYVKTPLRQVPPTTVGHVYIGGTHYVTPEGHSATPPQGHVSASRAASMVVIIPPRGIDLARKEWRNESDGTTVDLGNVLLTPDILDTTSVPHFVVELSPGDLLIMPPGSFYQAQTVEKSSLTLAVEWIRTTGLGLERWFQNRNGGRQLWWRTLKPEPQRSRMMLHMALEESIDTLHDYSMDIIKIDDTVRWEAWGRRRAEMKEDRSTKKKTAPPKITSRSKSITQVGSLTVPSVESSSLPLINETMPHITDAAFPIWMVNQYQRLIRVFQLVLWDECDPIADQHPTLKLEFEVLDRWMDVLQKNDESCEKDSAEDGSVTELPDSTTGEKKKDSVSAKGGGTTSTTDRPAATPDNPPSAPSANNVTSAASETASDVLHQRRNRSSRPFHLRWIQSASSHADFMRCSFCQQFFWCRAICCRQCYRTASPTTTKSTTRGLVTKAKDAGDSAQASNESQPGNVEAVDLQREISALGVGSYTLCLDCYNFGRCCPHFHSMAPFSTHHMPDIRDLFIRGIGAWTRFLHAACLPFTPPPIRNLYDMDRAELGRLVPTYTAASATLKLMVERKLLQRVSCHQCRCSKPTWQVVVCAFCSRNTDNRISNRIYCNSCLFYRYGELMYDKRKFRSWECPHCDDNRCTNVQCFKRDKGVVFSEPERIRKLMVVSPPFLFTIFTADKRNVGALVDVRTIQTRAMSRTGITEDIIVEAERSLKGKPSNFTPAKEAKAAAAAGNAAVAAGPAVGAGKKEKTQANGHQASHGTHNTAPGQGKSQGSSAVAETGSDACGGPGQVRTQSATSVSCVPPLQLQSVQVPRAVAAGQAGLPTSTSPSRSGGCGSGVAFSAVQGTAVASSTATLAMEYHQPATDTPVFSARDQSFESPRSANRQNAPKSRLRTTTTRTTISHHHNRHRHSRSRSTSRSRSLRHDIIMAEEGNGGPFLEEPSGNSVVQRPNKVVYHIRKAKRLAPTLDSMPPTSTSHHDSVTTSRPTEEVPLLEPRKKLKRPRLSESHRHRTPRSESGSLASPTSSGTPSHNQRSSLSPTTWTSPHSNASGSAAARPPRTDVHYQSNAGTNLRASLSKIGFHKTLATMESPDHNMYDSIYRWLRKRSAVASRVFVAELMGGFEGMEEMGKREDYGEYQRRRAVAPVDEGSGPGSSLPVYGCPSARTFASATTWSPTGSTPSLLAAPPLPPPPSTTHSYHTSLPYQSSRSHHQPPPPPPAPAPPRRATTLATGHTYQKHAPNPPSAGSSSSSAQPVPSPYPSTANSSASGAITSPVNIVGAMDTSPGSARPQSMGNLAHSGPGSLPRVPIPTRSGGNVPPPPAPPAGLPPGPPARLPSIGPLSAIYQPPAAPCAPPPFRRSSHHHSHSPHPNSYPPSSPYEPGHRSPNAEILPQPSSSSAAGLRRPSVAAHLGYGPGEHYELPPGAGYEPRQRASVVTGHPSHGAGEAPGYNGGQSDRHAQPPDREPQRPYHPQFSPPRTHHHHSFGHSLPQPPPSALPYPHLPPHPPPPPPPTAAPDAAVPAPMHSSRHREHLSHHHHHNRGYVAHQGGIAGVDQSQRPTRPYAAGTASSASAFYLPPTPSTNAGAPRSSGAPPPSGGPLRRPAGHHQQPGLQQRSHNHYPQVHRLARQTASSSTGSRSHSSMTTHSCQTTHEYGGGIQDSPECDSRRGVDYNRAQYRGRSRTRTRTASPGRSTHQGSSSTSSISPSRNTCVFGRTSPTPAATKHEAKTSWSPLSSSASTVAGSRAGSVSSSSSHSTCRSGKRRRPGGTHSRPGKRKMMTISTTTTNAMALNGARRTSTGYRHAVPPHQRDSASPTADHHRRPRAVIVDDYIGSAATKATPTAAMAADATYGVGSLPLPPPAGAPAASGHGQAQELYATSQRLATAG